MTYLEFYKALDEVQHKCLINLESISSIHLAVHTVFYERAILIIIIIMVIFKCYFFGELIALSQKILLKKKKKKRK